MTHSWCYQVKASLKPFLFHVWFLFLFLLDIVCCFRYFTRRWACPDLPVGAISMTSACFASSYILSHQVQWHNQSDLIWVISHTQRPIVIPLFPGWFILKSYVWLHFRIFKTWIFLTFFLMNYFSPKTKHVTKDIVLFSKGQLGEK